MSSWLTETSPPASPPQLQPRYKFALNNFAPNNFTPLQVRPQQLVTGVKLYRGRSCTGGEVVGEKYTGVKLCWGEVVPGVKLLGEKYTGVKLYRG